MSTDKITIKAELNIDRQKAWELYTNPKHIVNWNFADPSWCCPFAENDMTIGGIYKARMEAKDGSFGFDFEGVYSNVALYDQFTYGFEDRMITVSFKEVQNNTEMIITFDPEKENPLELQRNGWQAILNNFKKYAEAFNS